MSSLASTHSDLHAPQSEQSVRCPRCVDGELSRHVVQEHTSCGCVLYATEFAAVPDSTCPKCRRELTPGDLAEIGVLSVCDGCGTRTDQFASLQSQEQ
jgi:hypothetical protein